MRTQPYVQNLVVISPEPESHSFKRKPKKHMSRQFSEWMARRMLARRLNRLEKRLTVLSAEQSGRIDLISGLRRQITELRLAISTLNARIEENTAEGGWIIMFDAYDPDQFASELQRLALLDSLNPTAVAHHADGRFVVRATKAQVARPSRATSRGVGRIDRKLPPASSEPWNDMDDEVRRYEALAGPEDLEISENPLSEEQESIIWANADDDKEEAEGEEEEEDPLFDLGGSD